MRVDLGYAYDGHEPDDTIEVDDEVGRQLILDGVARVTPTEDAPLPEPPAPIQVELGYAYDGHAPDDTIEVPTEEGQRLLNDGVARLPVDESAAPTDAPPPEPSTPAGSTHTEENN